MNGRSYINFETKFQHLSIIDGVRDNGRMCLLNNFYYQAICVPREPRRDPNPNPNPNRMFYEHRVNNVVKHSMASFYLFIYYFVLLASVLKFYCDTGLLPKLFDGIDNVATTFKGHFFIPVSMITSLVIDGVWKKIILRITLQWTDTRDEPGWNSESNHSVKCRIKSNRVVRRRKQQVVINTVTAV